MYIEARNIAAIDLSSFRSHLQAGRDSCITLSDEQLHRLLQNLLDQRTVSSRPPSPWFCGVGPQLLEAKPERSRAERQRLKSGLGVHKQIFRFPFRLQTCQQDVQQAKSTFFNTKILACTSPKQLFSITNTLLGKSKISSLPSSIPSALLPQSFCDFFVNKISNIRDNLSSQTMPPHPVSQTHSF